MNQINLELIEAELDLAAMTPQEREEAEHRALTLEKLQKIRIRAAMNLPPLEFLFNMLDKPCFPRGEVVTVTGKPKSGKTFFLSLLMTACTADRDVIGIKRATNSPPLKCLWYDTEQCQQSTREIIAERIRPMAAESEHCAVSSRPGGHRRHLRPDQGHQRRNYCESCRGGPDENSASV